MPRRSSTPQVTLFPFLAVLICTMGALILLLLVSARRIRQQQLEAAAQPPAPVVLEAVEEPPPLLPLLADDAAELQRAREAVARERADYESRLAQRQRSQEELDREWSQRIDRARQRQAELESVEEQLRQRARAAQEAAQDLARQRQRLEQQLASATVQQRLLERTQGLDGGELARLDAEVTRLQRQLAEMNAASASSRPEFQVVAFDAQTGTSRRPILIECTATEIRFGAERVALTSQQLSGYDSSGNPLLAGATALEAYWKEHDARKFGAAQEPYVLLLVRPGGTTAFYVARKLLENHKQPFGFELLTEDEQIRWPNADPGAVAACRAAVDRALQQRKPEVVALGSVVLPGPEPLGVAAPRGGPLPFGGGETSSGNRPPQGVAAGGGGGAEQGEEFQLEEINKLRSAPEQGLDRLRPEWMSGAEQKPNLLSRDGPNSAAGIAVRNFADEVARAKADQRQAREQPPPGATGMPRDSQQLPPRPGARASLIDDGGPKRKWGRSGPSGAIGIEKPVTLHLSSRRIHLESGAGFDVGDMDKARMQTMVAQLLDQEANSWGAPPNKFEWRPKLTIVIHPGGHQHYARTKELLDHWGLGSTVERVLD